MILKLFNKKYEILFKRFTLKQSTCFPAYVFVLNEIISVLYRTLIVYFSAIRIFTKNGTQIIFVRTIVNTKMTAELSTIGCRGDQADCFSGNLYRYNAHVLYKKTRKIACKQEISSGQFKSPPVFVPIVIHTDRRTDRLIPPPLKIEISRNPFLVQL